MKKASKQNRKRHAQQDLFRRGGKRKGAGRKPKGARAGSAHQARPRIKPSQALHVVMRVVPAVGNMRRRELYKALRDATITAALREHFRIIHLSIQRTHIHMMVEAEDRGALARGMQGFQVSAARNINTALGPDRCAELIHRMGEPEGQNIKVYRMDEPAGPNIKAHRMGEPAGSDIKVHGMDEPAGSDIKVHRVDVPAGQNIKVHRMGKPAESNIIECF